MKRFFLILLILSILCNLYQYQVHNIDIACRKHLGWEFYAVFPEPMCHVESHTSTLRQLDNIIERKTEFVDI